MLTVSEFVTLYSQSFAKFDTSDFPSQILNFLDSILQHSIINSKFLTLEHWIVL